MGNWYTNIAVKHPNAAEVLHTLGQLGRHAIVHPAQNRWLTVFDEECDKFDLDLLESLALTLSNEHGCLALPCFNADDDLLWLALYENGRRVSRYASSVREFEDANEFPPIADFASGLCRAWDRPEQVNAVRGVLGRPHGPLGLLRLVHLNIAYVAEIQRHVDLAKIVGLPAASVGLGYTYVARGELAEGMQAENLLRTFGRTTN